MKKDRFQSWRTANYIGMAYNIRMWSYYGMEDNIQDRFGIFYPMFGFVVENNWHFKSLSWLKNWVWSLKKSNNSAQ